MANENLWSHEKWSATVDQLFGCFMVDCRPNLVTLAKIAFSGEYSIPGGGYVFDIHKYGMYLRGHLEIGYLLVSPANKPGRNDGRKN
eukprot:scaffold10964_cov146-Skeletonema_marinoi.AAC.3